MPKAAKDRKTPSCVLCGAYNATRRTSHPGVGTYPLCRQCHVGGLENYGGDPSKLFQSVHGIATRNHALTLEDRKYVGDAHIQKDGQHSDPTARLAQNDPAAHLRSVGDRNAEWLAGQRSGR